MNKKAAELSINIIIIAVIALLVLGVVVFIFYDQIKKVATGFTETREKTQICQVGWLGSQKCLKSNITCESLGIGWKQVSARCEAEDEICCEKEEKTNNLK